MIYLLLAACSLPRCPLANPSLIGCLYTDTVAHSRRTNLRHFLVAQSFFFERSSFGTLIYNKENEAAVITCTRGTTPHNLSCEEFKKLHRVGWVGMRRLRRTHRSFLSMVWLNHFVFCARLGTFNHESERELNIVSINSSQRCQPS